MLGPIVRSVLNGEIKTSFASNLVCAHDFGASPPGKCGAVA